MKMRRFRDDSLVKVQGFSMVEIMVTLVVVAVISALAAPSLMLMAPNISLKAAARDLYSKLHEAKMLAIKENSPVSVRFSAAYYYTDRDSDGAYTASAVDTFTDVNGDGAYNIGEPYSDVDGDGKYSGEIAINFDEYGYGISFGSGNATANWSGNPCNPTGVITFNSRGSSSSGSVYLQNKNNDVSYAVTVRTAGSIKTRKYSGAKPFDQDYWN